MSVEGRAAHPIWQTIRIDNTANEYQEMLAKRRNPHPIRSWEQDVLNAIAKEHAACERIHTSLAELFHPKSEYQEDTCMPRFYPKYIALEVDLVSMSVEELTGLEEATYEQILSAARREGCHECPIEILIILLLRFYKDRSIGKYLLILTQPITDSIQSDVLFSIFTEEEDALLIGGSIKHKEMYSAEHRVVLMQAARPIEAQETASV